MPKSGNSNLKLTMSALFELQVAAFIEGIADAPEHEAYGLTSLEAAEIIGRSICENGLPEETV